MVDIFFNAILLCVLLGMSEVVYPWAVLHNVKEHWLQGPRLAALWIGVLLNTPKLVTLTTHHSTDSGQSDQGNCKTIMMVIFLIMGGKQDSLDSKIPLQKSPACWIPLKWKY